MEKWIQKANCRGLPVSIFFKDLESKRNSNNAKEICSNCQVKLECKEAGKNEPFGIWGGEQKKMPRYYRGVA